MRPRTLIRGNADDQRDRGTGSGCFNEAADSHPRKLVVRSARVAPGRASMRPRTLIRGNSIAGSRSEERRVGKECRSRWWAYQEKKKRTSKTKEWHKTARDYE